MSKLFQFYSLTPRLSISVVIYTYIWYNDLMGAESPSYDPQLAERQAVCEGCKAELGDLAESLDVHVNPNVEYFADLKLPEGVNKKDVDAVLAALYPSQNFELESLPQLEGIQAEMLVYSALQKLSSIRSLQSSLPASIKSEEIVGKLSWADEAFLGDVRSAVKDPNNNAEEAINNFYVDFIEQIRVARDSLALDENEWSQNESVLITEGLQIMSKVYFDQLQKDYETKESRAGESEKVYKGYLEKVFGETEVNKILEVTEGLSTKKSIEDFFAGNVEYAAAYRSMQKDNPEIIKSLNISYLRWRAEESAAVQAENEINNLHRMKNLSDVIHVLNTNPRYAPFLEQHAHDINFESLTTSKETIQALMRFNTRLVSESLASGDSIDDLIDVRILQRLVISYVNEKKNYEKISSAKQLFASVQEIRKDPQTFWKSVDRRIVAYESGVSESKDSTEKTDTTSNRLVSTADIMSGDFTEMADPVTGDVDIKLGDQEGAFTLNVRRNSIRPKGTNSQYLEVPRHKVGVAQVINALHNSSYITSEAGLVHEVKQSGNKSLTLFIESFLGVRSDFELSEIELNQWKNLGLQLRTKGVGLHELLESLGATKRDETADAGQQQSVHRVIERLLTESNRPVSDPDILINRLLDSAAPVPEPPENDVLAVA